MVSVARPCVVRLESPFAKSPVMIFEFDVMLTVPVAGVVLLVLALVKYFVVNVEWLLRSKIPVPALLLLASPLLNEPSEIVIFAWLVIIIVPWPAASRPAPPFVIPYLVVNSA